MNVAPTRLDGVLLLQPTVFHDDRGFFFESYNQRVFEAAVGAPVRFVQDNHSRSSKGVLRGLHFQRSPHAQGKLVRVVQGSVFDVVVDMRPGSATFGSWVSVELSAENQQQLWVPGGLAHGFIVTSDAADVLYKTTAHRFAPSEGVIRWDDRDLAIGWPIAGPGPIVSAKDAAAGSFRDAVAAQMHGPGP